jgi:hypothetical protein
MNTRVKTLLIAAAIAAGASALGSQAADRDDFSIDPTPAGKRPSTVYQDEENAWLTAERSRPQGVPPTPFPVPAAAPVGAKSPPATPYQSAENKWLTQERNETDGNMAPVPFPVPATQ